MLDLTKLIDNKVDKDIILTPNKIAEEMVYKSILDDEITIDIKIIDPVCKSGVYLVYWKERLMSNQKFINNFPNKQDRENYILNNNIFGITLTDMTKLISVRNVNGVLGRYNNIITIDNYIDSVRNNTNKIILELKEKFNIMKFDVVIGNPPYNRGDIDFVHLAYQLSKKYVCMITPAKWQTAEAGQIISSENLNYGQFRELYTKHMKYICYYPCCKDLFNILQVDGITYYILDIHNTYEKCTVENKCKYIKEFNSISERSIINGETLFNIGAEIIEYLGDYTKFDFGYCIGKRFQVYTNSQVPGGGLSTVENTRKTQFVGVSEILDREIDRYTSSGTCSLSFESSSLDECKSFVSWINCKFTRFFVAIYISKLTGVICKHTFKFVPAPPSGKFDHIYTDKELYEAFNLPQKYIDIIESVIKERK